MRSEFTLRLFVCFLFVLMLVSHASARLGETMVQCEARYGKSTSVDKPTTVMFNGHPRAGSELDAVYHYTHGVYNIAISYVDGEAGIITIMRPDTLTLGDDEIQALLSADSGILKWNADQAIEHQATSWTRDDGCTAAFIGDDKLGHSLVLTSKTYVDALAAYNKQQDELSVKKTQDSLKGM